MSTEQQNSVGGLGLLLVDLQEGFLKSIGARESLVRRCHFAIKAARLFDIPVAFTEQVPDKLGPTLPELVESAGEGAAVFAKQAFSAFRAPGLDEWIADNQVRHLLLGGLEIPICVYQTAVDAVQKQIPLTLLSDCLGARRDDDAQTTLHFLSTHTQHVVLPSETLFYSMLGSAESPLFREFTRLVKQAC